MSVELVLKDGHLRVDHNSSRVILRNYDYNEAKQRDLLTDGDGKEYVKEVWEAEKEFAIAVTWSVSGRYKVMARTIEEAKDKVLDSVPPYDKLPEGDYIDDSMTIDSDTTCELNCLSESENDDE